MMLTFTVDAAEDIPVPIIAKNSLHLMPEVIGIIHADNGSDRTELPEYVLDQLLLVLQLYGIRIGHECTSSAIFIQGTFLISIHDSYRDRKHEVCQLSFILLFGMLTI